MSASVALRIARALVRLAALRAPARRRGAMVAEWDGELAAEARAGGGWRLVGAALGAFADARGLSRLGRRAGAARGASTGRSAGPSTGPSTGPWAGTTMRTTTGWEEGGSGALAGWSLELARALRSLARAKGFTAVAVLTLAIGIGGSAAVWTLLDRVVLDPLPYPAAERLVRILNAVPGVGPDEVWHVSPAQWIDLGERAGTLERVGLYRSGRANVQTPAGAERVASVRVTASMMDLLGARARVGRLIGPDDDRADAPPVALLSHGFWQRVTGGDPDVVGRTLALDGAAVEVVGVLEPGLSLPEQVAGSVPDLWLPFRLARVEGPGFYSHVNPAVGRLAAGATAADAEREIRERITPRLAERFPNGYGPGFFERFGFRTRVVPLRDDVVGDLARSLWILLGAVSFVLLVACANVANLFLVRAEGREREMAIRAALGAGRSALARQILAEGVVLGLLGGAVALVVGYWALPALSALAPAGLPRIRGAALGLDTVAWTLALSLAAGLALAAYPVLLHARRGPASALAGGARAGAGGPGRQRFRSALAVTQMALALTLVVGAGLLVRTVRNLHAVEIGFRPEGVLAADLVLSPEPEGAADEAAYWNVYREVLARVRGMPGVLGAGMAEALPVADGFGCTVQGFEDRGVYERVREAGLTTCAGQVRVTSGFFEALGVPVLAGRTFTDADTDGGERTVVVSRAFAERFWPGVDPLGQGVAPEGRVEGPFHRVIGVVGDVPAASNDDQRPLSQTAIAVYYPSPGAMTLVARTDAPDPLSLLPALRLVVAEIEPELPLSSPTDLESVVQAALARVSFVSLLLGIAAGMALFLAAVGLFGVTAWVVARRTREIGVRMAIGARPADVERAVVGRALALAGLGLALGGGLALATSRVLGALLVGVEPTDPLVFAAAAGSLALVALVAAWIPARRAARVQPVEALGSE